MPDGFSETPKAQAQAQEQDKAPMIVPVTECSVDLRRPGSIENTSKVALYKRNFSQKKERRKEKPCNSIHALRRNRRPSRQIRWT